ncbi:MAG: TPM domain-containing protein, partial [Saprospiraceae bacterium]|nr:TPM domain-containing protein [Saprospiraceae bacterium]
MHKFLLATLLVLTGMGLWAQKSIPPPPNPPRLVNDYAGMLSAGEKQRLEDKLVAYNDSTSTQIAIVIEASLKGEDIFDYSYRIAESWGIGGGENNNGVLIYVAQNDRKVRIQTGYGVEHFLPDVMAKRIIENI